ncbi:lipopolysaccharide assembly protein LapB [uncultured Serinicoccus sp.]|uniref:tetratricopeptide repeat protein n=1 Tax=uncultured Serinicoccus sp. TaxID=735514 RepID=UPI00261EFE86|nr:tetratricopeptide repeat protein [uncultured Serinicoccus sp.]
MNQERPVSGPRPEGRERRDDGRGRRGERRGRDDGAREQQGRGGPRGGPGAGRPSRADSADRSDVRRPTRIPEPPLPEDADAGGLDRSLRSELRTLSKENAEGVGGHLVMVGRLLDAEDYELALAHAEAAARRAGRVAGVRETLGVVYYRRGEWAKALAEFRTARRLSGSQHLLPLMADVERGLGRPERAVELAASPEAARLAAAEQVELAIVVTGARADLGQHAAAVQHIERLARASTARQPWAARVRYAYASALEGAGRVDEAQEWYASAAEVDVNGETDAAERLGTSDEAWVVDLGDDDPVEGTDRSGAGTASRHAGEGRGRPENRS